MAYYHGEKQGASAADIGLCHGDSCVSLEMLDLSEP